MHFFVGTKNPPMPSNLYKNEVKPLKLLCEKFGKSQLSSEKFFMFLKETLTNSKVPDFHDFNTRATREFGQSIKSKRTFKQLSRLKCQKLHNLPSEAESSTTYWKNAVEVKLKYTLLF